MLVVRQSNACTGGIQLAYIDRQRTNIVERTYNIQVTYAQTFRSKRHIVRNMLQNAVAAF